MEHIERRRSYVQDIRKSFDTPKSSYDRNQKADISEGNNQFSFFKVRLILAVIIFAAFVLCDQTNTLFYTHSTKDIAQKIVKNYDYTDIEDYVITMAQKTGL